MSWAGIFLVHVPDGVPSEAAINATVHSWIANPAVPGSHLMAVPDDVQIDHDPEWPSLALEVLMNVNPSLERIDGSGSGWDAGWLDDGTGPVYFKVCGTEVQLRPKKFWDNPEGIDGFTVMWEYATALGQLASCVAHDPDEDLVIDLSLDLEIARSVYNWV
jgi:hypothetical protein